MQVRPGERPTEVVIRPLTRDDVEAAFSLVCRVFVQASALHVALGVTLGQYREHLREPFEAMLDEGLSLVAVDARSKEPVGCLVARDYALRERSDVRAPTRLEPIDVLLEALARPYDATTPNAAGECMLVDMAVVSPGARRRGIYRRLREAAHRVGRAAGFVRVVGELSSAATQHLCVARFGHRVRSEVAFASFEHAGREPFAGIRVPPSIQLVEGALR